jgi:hypothetical protein
MLYLLGIFLIFLGEPLSAYGQVLQKKYHTLHKVHAKDYERPWHKSKRFWGYYIIEYFGSVITSFSLMFIPIIIFIPLTNFRLIVNIYFSRKVLKEEIFKSDYIATFIIFTGSFLVVYFGNHQSTPFSEEMLIRNFSDISFIITTCLYLLAFFGSFYAHKKINKVIYRRAKYFRNSRKSITEILLKLRFMTICLFSSIISSICSLFSNLIIMSFPELYKSGFTWSLIKCTLLISIFSIFIYVLNLIIFQQLIKKYKSILLFPVSHIFHVVFSIIYSIVFFNIFNNVGFTDILLFIFGVIISLFGVFVKTIHHLSLENIRRVDSTSEFSIDPEDENYENISEIV